MLDWKPFPYCKHNIYADGDSFVDHNRIRYYVSKTNDNRWTPDINGCTLFEYRPSKAPIFFDTKEEAIAACERDLIALQIRWNHMLDQANTDPKFYRRFSQLS